MTIVILCEWLMTRIGTIMLSHCFLGLRFAAKLILCASIFASTAKAQELTARVVSIETCRRLTPDEDYAVSASVRPGTNWLILFSHIPDNLLAIRISGNDFKANANALDSEVKSVESTYLLHPEVSICTVDLHVSAIPSGTRNKVADVKAKLFVGEQLKESILSLHSLDGTELQLGEAKARFSEVTIVDGKVAFRLTSEQPLIQVSACCLQEESGEEIQQAQVDDNSDEPDVHGRYSRRYQFAAGKKATSVKMRFYSKLVERSVLFELPATVTDH